MKIRSKLGLTYVTVSLLALALISILLYSYVKKELTSEVLNHLESVSTIQKHRIERIVSEYHDHIRLMSSRTQLRISLNSFLQTGNRKDREKIELILNDALASLSYFLVISILDLDGKVLLSTDGTRIGRDFSGYDFFTTSHIENSARHFFLNEEQKLDIYLSGPLTIEDRLIGILLIESDAENIVSALQDYSGLRQTGETVLGRTGKEGGYVQYLTPLRFDPDAALRRSVNINQTENAMVKAVSAQKQELTTALDYRNQEVLAVINYIPQTKWGLVVKIDEAEAFQPIKTLMQYIIVLMVILLAIIILVSYLFANIISKPIRELTSAAHVIDGGDLHHRANINSDDELGELASTFNHMTDNLVKTQADLEKTNKELMDHRDHLEEMVSTRTRELEHSLKELESFSYSVSHDLRSPLRAIDGYSHLLIEDFGDQMTEEGLACFQRIRQASQRMGDLIDDLLELSRINRKEFNPKNFNFSVKVESTVKMLKVDSQRDVELIIAPELKMYADESLMDVVANNLISNAWKYTGQCKRARIEVGEIQKNGNVIYFVKDNGIGFDNEYAEKIFGPFQRLVRQDEYPGTGIGLATVLRVIQRHGGRIWAEGEPGKGATFYFTITPA